jgi:hypothetical protein
MKQHDEWLPLQQFSALLKLVMMHRSGDGNVVKLGHKTIED